MNIFNPFKRAENWKRYVEASLQELRRSIADLNARNDVLSGRLEEIGRHLREVETLAQDVKRTINAPRAGSGEHRSLTALLDATHRSQSIVTEALCARFEADVLARHFVVPERYEIHASRRGAELLLLICDRDLNYNDDSRTIDFDAYFAAADSSLVVLIGDSADHVHAVTSDALLEDMRARPSEAKAWLDHRGRKPRPVAPPAPTLDEALRRKDLIDFTITAEGGDVLRPHLASYLPAEPRRRSVLFTRHCYYNFYYLAKALRARGWDAVSLSTEAPDGAHGWLYHGQDLNLFDPDPIAHRQLIGQFHSSSAGRFGIHHHYGLGVFSLFPDFYDAEDSYSAVPWDMIEAKRRGVLLGYSHSGCLDGVSQSSFRAWSPNMCRSCPWELRPHICSDAKNLAWGRKVTALADLVCTETDPSMDYKGSAKTFRAPLTFAIDPELWEPGIVAPPALERGHPPGKVIVYHAVGNFEERSREGRNVKGTQAVLAAVARLREEGVDIEIDFVDKVASRDNRFVQAQADIIVDQLNYGRYGALAREGMMLGKPVVGRVNKVEHDGSPATACILETPIVHADEDSVVDVLRDLALNPAKRAEIGRASREHAIKWWSADRLAERFERVYDHLRDHGRPPAEEDVP